MVKGLGLTGSSLGPWGAVRLDKYAIIIIVVYCQQLEYQAGLY
jgi:hypothetical protein